VIGAGNHDTHVTKHNHTDLVALLVQRLNSGRHDTVDVRHGGYTGLVRYALGKGRRPFQLFYHHGTGKDAKASGGAGQYANFHWIEGVDVVWLGHLHSRLVQHFYRFHTPAIGDEPEERHVAFVRTGSYLKTYSGQGQSSVWQQGMKTNYGSIAAHCPHGRGGARVSLALTKKAFDMEVTQ
jgi:hypothetical protein